MHQYLRPLEVAEKAQAKAVPVASPFDQTWHVGKHEAPLVVEPDDAEVGGERGERVVGDLGARGRHAGDEGRLADVGKPYQTDIREEFEREAQPVLLTRAARFGAARRPVRRRREPFVAASSAAASGDEQAAVGRGQIREPYELLVVQPIHDRPDRDVERQVRAVAAGAARSFTMRAAACLELSVETVVDEGVAVDARAQMHRAAAPAVAAVGAAAGNELLAAKAHAAAPAVTRLNLDVDLVDEHTLRRCTRAGLNAGWYRLRRIGRCSLGRVDADEPPPRAVVLERDAAGALGEKGVVLAETDIDTGPESAAVLSHQDGSALDQVPVEALDAKPLSLTVPPIS